MKKIKKVFVGGLAFAAIASCALSVTAVFSTEASAEIDESKFQMVQAFSVRMGTGTSEDPTGLRFKTLATDFKADLNAVYPESSYTYQWYTNINFKTFTTEDGDPKTTTDSSGNVYTAATAYDMDVRAETWNEEGWNTLLLNIPESDYATRVEAQSFVTVSDANGTIVYEAKTITANTSIAQTASWALNGGSADAQLQSYVDAVAESVSFVMPKVGLWVGGSDYLTVKTKPINYGVVYSTSDASTVTVDKTGKITALKAGTATITAKFGTHTATCEVTVRSDSPVVEDFEDGVNSALVAGSDPGFYGTTSSSTSGQLNIVTYNDSKMIRGWQAKNTMYFEIPEDYLHQTFAVSDVKALRFKLYGVGDYSIRQFMLQWLLPSGSWSALDDAHTRFEKKTDYIELQINRQGYEDFIKTQGTEFNFRLQFVNAANTWQKLGAGAGAYFYFDDFTPIYDPLTEDFEYGVSSSVTVNGTSESVAVLDRSMGRGDYSLAVTPTGNALEVGVTASYASKVFNAGSTYLEFRVYTDKDVTAATVNGSSDYVEYVYRVDGYYVVRVGAGAYTSGTALTVALTASEDFGTAYLDAFTGKADKTIAQSGTDTTRSVLITTEIGGAPNYSEKTDSFDFYSYSSVNDGKVNVDGIYLDYGSEMTLEKFKEYREAGYEVIMPQTAAVIGNYTGVTNKTTTTWWQVLEMAQQADLKVLFTDNMLLFLSSNRNGSYNSYYNHNGAQCNMNEAAPVGSKMWNQVKGQLKLYYTHPAFYGVLLKDEVGSGILNQGYYGFVYKTIVAVNEVLKEECKNDLAAIGQEGKNVYIHGNLVGPGGWSKYGGYSSSSGTYTWHYAEEYGAFPELTVAEYCELSGMPNSSAYTVDANGYSTDPATFTSTSTLSTECPFYYALNTWMNTTLSPNECQRRQEARLKIMKARYQKYCELYLEKTGAPYVAPDLYPLYSEGPMDSSLGALEAAAIAAAKYDAYLMVVSQTMSYVPSNSDSDRILDDESVRWLNNTLLSYGVKNISYFTYYVHGDDGSGYFLDESSPMYLTGQRAPLWYSMQKIFAENQAFAPTYMQFELYKTHTYYDKLSVYNNMHVVVNSDQTIVRYDENGNALTVKESALASWTVDKEAAYVNELYDYENGYFMYAVMNVVDAQTQTFDSYQTATLTFAYGYTHAVVWRNGVKTLVKLDANNSITVENAPGEAVYIIPYVASASEGYIQDVVNKDNGVYFPGDPNAGDVWNA